MLSEHGMRMPVSRGEVLKPTSFPGGSEPKDRPKVVLYHGRPKEAFLLPWMGGGSPHDPRVTNVFRLQFPVARQWSLGFLPKVDGRRSATCPYMGRGLRHGNGATSTEIAISRALCPIFMQRVFDITESGTTESGGVVNLAHCYSDVNRKYIPQVDKKGNAQLFTVLLKVSTPGTSVNTVSVDTASNGYVTKQAVKAWHRVWREQFREAGISMSSLGPYSQNLRVRLAPGTETRLGSGNEDGTGEWSDTLIAQAAPADPSDSGTLTVDKMHDTYFLHLTGSSAAQSGSGTDTFKWDSVGMIESWMGARRKHIGLDGGAVSEALQVEADNPLLAARYDKISSATLIDETRKLQAEEPPYTEAVSKALLRQGTVTSVGGSDAQMIVNAPCGLMAVNFTQACSFTIELIGISDM